ncbi:deubiquitinase DESI2, partial [Caerostris extrusa]
MAREPVILNVYDMYWINDYTSPLGIGVFHSGVEIYGCEYAYGGHPFNFSGIFEIHPRDAADLGDHFRFREAVLIPKLPRFTEQEWHRVVEELGKNSRGCYHLMSKKLQQLFTRGFTK